jgi:hypothetical protein
MVTDGKLANLADNRYFRPIEANPIAPGSRVAPSTRRRFIAHGLFPSLTCPGTGLE